MLVTHNTGALVAPVSDSNLTRSDLMATKEVFVEILKPCWIKGVDCGTGSIVKLPQNEANLCAGLKKGKIVNAAGEKIVPHAKPAAAKAPKAEK